MTDSRLVLIDAKANLGFAGGNNLALRYLRTRGYGSYFWLLNNDTVVEKGALNALICRMVADPAIGMCGSTLLYESARDTVQALGGAHYGRWLGTVKHIGHHERWPQRVDEGAVERQLSYLIGASTLASRAFLETVGLMQDDYFLYFEELDWAARAKGRFRLGYAARSTVYHKEGSSIGGNDRAKASKSYTADLYALTVEQLVELVAVAPHPVEALLRLVHARPRRGCGRGPNAPLAGFPDASARWRPRPSRDRSRANPSVRR